MEIGGEYMQYGVDISTYKRLESRNNKKEVRLQSTPIKTVTSFIVGFLLSRVLLSVTVELGIAPFGIAYLMGIKKERSKDMLLPLVGVIFGYLSIYKTLEGAMAYCIVAIIVLFYSEICDRIELKQRDTVTFVLIFLTFYGYIIINLVALT